MRLLVTALTLSAAITVIGITFIGRTEAALPPSSQPAQASVAAVTADIGMTGQFLLPVGASLTPGLDFQFSHQQIFGSGNGQEFSGFDLLQNAPFGEPSTLVPAEHGRNVMPEAEATPPKDDEASQQDQQSAPFPPPQPVVPSSALIAPAPQLDVPASQPLAPVSAPQLAALGSSPGTPESEPVSPAPRGVSSEAAPPPNPQRPGHIPAPPVLTPIVHIQFHGAALAPMAHTVFCLNYRDDCKVVPVVFRGGLMSLTNQRWDELQRVNNAVNHAIKPQPNTGGLATEKWLIAPKAGECHDYAVTKRHELLALGWPERNLLLAEVVTSWGEHHLVLVVRANEGDFVADSLTAQIVEWQKAPYQWVRIQTPANPMFWAGVTRSTVWVSKNELNRHDS